MAVLYANIGGTWVPVGGGSGGGTGSDEVFIQDSDPIGSNPTAELWYDTDAVMTGSADIDGGTPAATDVPSVDGGPP
jgi:hypothetical protein